MTRNKKYKSVQKIFFSLVNFTAFGITTFGIPAFGITAFKQTAFAQTTDNGTSSFSVKNLTVTGQNIDTIIGEGKHPIAAYIIRTINFLSLTIGSLALLAIIVGGIMLLTSGGKESQTTKGKDIIKDAIIGLVVAFCAYFITAYVQSVFYEYGTASS
jgi:hypothetical protein